MSGQKKHTLKTHIIVDKKKKAIVCTNCFNGKRHDFRLFKESGVPMHPEIKSRTDTGYKLHQNSALPKKKTKKKSIDERR